MKKPVALTLHIISFSLLFFLSQSCTQKSSSNPNFVIAPDSCFKNTLKSDDGITFNMIKDKMGYQYPYIKKSLLHMPGAEVINDSTAFLSRDKEIRITSWIKHKFQGRKLKSYQDLVNYNTYVVQQNLFMPDTSSAIVKNIMFKNCKYPSFIIQGTTEKYIYFLKTELSPVPILHTQALKNCLIRFPKKLKNKYWSTVHEMLAKTGFYQVDTVKIKKQIDRFADKYRDSLKKWIKD